MSESTSNGRGRRCPVCGRGILRSRLISEVFEYGDEGDSVLVRTQDVPVEDCAACGESFSGPKAARIRHEAIGRALGLFAPQDIRAIRGRLRSIVDWGSSPVPGERASDGQSGLSSGSLFSVVDARSSDHAVRIVRFGPHLTLLKFPTFRRARNDVNPFASFLRERRGHPRSARGTTIAVPRASGGGRRRGPVRGRPARRPGQAGVRSLRQLQGAPGRHVFTSSRLRIHSDRSRM